MSFWLRIIIYLVVCIVCCITFSIPLLIAFPELIQHNYPSIKNNEWYHLGNQFATALGIALGTYIMVVKIECKRLNDYLINLTIRGFFYGFLLGLAIMTVFAVLLASLGKISFDFNKLSFHLLFSFVLYFFVALAEELLVRGYILNNLKEKFNPPLALISSSLFFGLLHIGNDHFTWIGLANISLSGFLMGLVALRSQNISSAIGLHWSWNFFQGPVFGFAVSGHQETGIFTPNSLSSHIITGGLFGAEGSIALAVISLVFTALVYWLFPNLDNGQ
jgi:uncharacterized protein